MQLCHMGPPKPSSAARTMLCVVVQQWSHKSRSYLGRQGLDSSLPSKQQLSRQAGLALFPFLQLFLKEPPMRPVLRRTASHGDKPVAEVAMRAGFSMATLGAEDMPNSPSPMQP